jgi:hypothetical protein
MELVMFFFFKKKIFIFLFLKEKYSFQVLFIDQSIEGDKNCKTKAINVIMNKSDTIGDLKQKLIDKKFIESDKKITIKFDNEKINEIDELGTFNFRQNSLLEVAIE